MAKMSATDRAWVEARGIPKKLPAIRPYTPDMSKLPADKCQTVTKNFEDFAEKTRQEIVAQISKRMFGLCDGSAMGKAVRAAHQAVRGKKIKALILDRSHWETEPRLRWVVDSSVVDAEIA